MWGNQQEIENYKRWIPCFEDVNAVIFMADLSSYDQKNTEIEHLLLEYLPEFPHEVILEIDSYIGNFFLLKHFTHFYPRKGKKWGEALSI